MVRALLALATVLSAGCAQKSEHATTHAPPEKSASDVETPKTNKATPGSELVGTRPPAWSLDDWQQSKALTLEELRGQVVVLRFWTSPNCPFCKKSLPAMQGLADEFQDQPVSFIGAYHAKPRGSIKSMEEPMKTAKEWGIRFPLALDRDWNTLTQWWLSTGSRRATSATFVLAKDGTIAHVHPGPEFFPSKLATDAAPNADYVAIRQAIKRELDR